MAPLGRAKPENGWLRAIRRRHSSSARDAQRVDIAFYVPFIGQILTGRPALPPGGAETQVLLLSKTLAREGLSVALIVYGDRRELPRTVDGVRVVVRPAPVKRRLIGKLTEAFQIWRALWKCPSRTVVYRCAGPHLGLVAVYTQVSGRQLVFSVANVVDFAYEKLARNRRELELYKLGVRLADKIVAQTEEQVALCERTFRRRPTVIKSLSPTTALTTTADAEAFLWIGRSVTYKRPLDYVQLALLVPEASFWMMAVPSEREAARFPFAELQRAVRDVPNLTLLAPRPHFEVQTLMTRVVASVNTAEYEGMPNVLLEAWCQGIPALVLRHDPNDVITQFHLGYFASGSLETMAAQARALWATRNDRFALSERCRQYVAEHHSPKAVARQWIALHSDEPGSLRHASSDSVGVCAG